MLGTCDVLGRKGSVVQHPFDAIITHIQYNIMHNIFGEQSLCRIRFTFVVQQHNFFLHKGTIKLKSHNIPQHISLVQRCRLQGG